MPPLLQWTLFLVGLWLMFLSVRGLGKKNRRLSQALAARAWPAVAGTIVEASIEEKHSGVTKSGAAITTYRPTVTYRYRVGEQEFTGVRLAFGMIMYRHPGEAEAFLVAHPEGGAVQVCYNPENPGESVLDRGPSHAQQGIGAEVVMFILGLGAVAACLWSVTGE